MCIGVVCLVCDSVMFLCSVHTTENVSFQNCSKKNILRGILCTFLFYYPVFYYLPDVYFIFLSPITLTVILQYIGYYRPPSRELPVTVSQSIMLIVYSANCV